MNTYLFLGGFGTFLRWLEMVLLHVNIADDVVVGNGVFSWTEVPRLILRVVRSCLESLQLVLEVQDVVSLLVP